MNTRTFFTGVAMGLSFGLGCADPNPATINQKCFADENCDAGQRCEKAAGADAGFCRDQSTADGSTSSGGSGATEPTATTESPGTSTGVLSTDTTFESSGGPRTTTGPTTTSGVISTDATSLSTTDNSTTDSSTTEETETGGSSTGGEEACAGVPEPDTVSFAPLSTIAVGANSQGMAIGDLDGDGVLDIVATSRGDNMVWSFLGDGFGNFGPPQTNLAGTSPAQIVLGAIADATVDAVIVQSADDNVRRSQGTGDGGFGNAQNVGSTTDALVLVDVNGDDVLDLLGNDGALTVAPGSVIGESFGAVVSYPTGLTGSGEIAVADFDGNLTPDVVVIGSTSFAIMLGNGLGAFTAQSSSFAGGGTSDVATGDFDDDGQNDLVIVTAGGGTDAARVHFGAGDGTFPTPPEILGTQSGPLYVGTADMDADGDDDIVVLHISGGVGVSLSNGDGTFTPQQTFSCDGHNNPRALALGDLNGDCALDVVSVSSSDGLLCLWLSN